MNETQELRNELRKARDEAAVLRRRVGVLELTIDTMKAEGQDLRFFTTEQVAKMLQVHPITVQNYIRNGLIKAIKPEKGGQFRISHKSLNDFIVRSTAEALETLTV